MKFIKRLAIFTASIILMACTTVTSSTSTITPMKQSTPISSTASAIPSSTPIATLSFATPIPTKIVLATTVKPNKLYEGSFIFHPQYDANNLSQAMFDFEEQKFDPNVNIGNDIRVDLTGEADTFIVVMPINGATGMYLKTVEIGVNFDLNSYFEDCLQTANEFLAGTEPIDYQGDLFCWKTRGGHLSDFVIEKINGSNI